MSDMKKLLEAMDSMSKSEKKPEGPKFPGYLKGTDPASKVRDKMVGSAQESVIKELAKTAKDTSTERKLKEEFANFQEQSLAESEYQELRKLQQQWWVALPAIMKKAGIDYQPVRELSRDYYPTLGWINIPGTGSASFEVNANPKGDAAKINISVDVGTSNEFYRTAQPERAAKLNAFAEKIAQALGGTAAEHMTGERRNHPGVSRITATMTLPKEPAEWQNPSRGYDPVARFLAQPGERARQSRVARSANPGSFGGDSSNYRTFEEGEVVQFPKKHKGDLDSIDDCPKCGGDLQGGKYMGHAVKVCMPCKQVYLPPNSGIDQKGNKIEEQGVAEGEEGITEFYVYIGREGDGGWIGRISKDGSKWREEGGEGNKPHNWGTAYMSYLTPDEVMQWIRQDYRRHEVEGPFLDDAEAYEYAEQMGGLDEDVAEEQVNEKSVSKAQFRTMAAAAHNPKFAKKVGISSKVAKEFHKADKKANYKSLPAKVDEDGQPDAITMDVPLMIRLFEYAREDAKTDMDLHDVAERLIALSQEGRTLTMQDYDTICPSQEQAVDEEQEAKYGNKYQDAVKRVGQKAREQEKRKPVDIAALAAKLAAMNKQVKELKEVAAIAPTGPTTAGGAPATQQGQATDQEAQDLVNTQKNLAKLKSVNPQLNPGMANQALQNIAANPQAPVAGAQMAQTKNLADLVGDALADPQKGSQVATLLQQVQQAKK